MRQLFNFLQIKFINFFLYLLIIILAVQSIGYKNSSVNASEPTYTSNTTNITNTTNSTNVGNTAPRAISRNLCKNDMDSSAGTVELMPYVSTHLTSEMEKKRFNKNLLVAVILGNLEGVKKALNSGADINQTVGSDSIPIVTAFLSGHDEVIDYLMSLDSLKLAVSTKSGETPLKLSFATQRYKQSAYIISRLLNEDLISLGKQLKYLAYYLHDAEDSLLVSRLKQILIDKSLISFLAQRAGGKADNQMIVHELEMVCDQLIDPSLVPPKYRYLPLELINAIVSAYCAFMPAGDLCANYSEEQIWQLRYSPASIEESVVNSIPTNGFNLDSNLPITTISSSSAALSSVASSSTASASSTTTNTASYAFSSSNLQMKKQALADRLEDKLEKYLQNSNNIVGCNYISPNNKGVNNTLILFYKDGNSAVFKTEDNDLSSFRREVAAYKLSKLLSLHRVPVTVEVRVTKDICPLLTRDAVGSAQFFLRYADTYKNLGTQFAWSKTVYFFDFLLLNCDRNIGNIMFPVGPLYNETQYWNYALIDHGTSFLSDATVAEVQSRKNNQGAFLYADWCKHMYDTSKIPLTAISENISTENANNISYYFPQREMLLKRLEQIDDATFEKLLTPYILNKQAITDFLTRKKIILEAYRILHF